MRNYIRVYGMNWILFLSDGFNNVDIAAATVASSTLELQSRITQQNNVILGGWPGFSIVADSSQGRTPDTIYVCLDRFNVVSFLQTLDLINYQTSVNNRFFLVNPDTSPRYTGWKDEKEEFRKVAASDRKGARPSFSGAPGLIIWVQNLRLIATQRARSVAQRRIKDEAKFLLGQIQAELITIAAAMTIWTNFLRGVG